MTIHRVSLVTTTRLFLALCYFVMTLTTTTLAERPSGGRLHCTPGRSCAGAYEYIGYTSDAEDCHVGCGDFLGYDDCGRINYVPLTDELGYCLRCLDTTTVSPPFVDSNTTTYDCVFLVQDQERVEEDDAQPQEDEEEDGKTAFVE